MKINGKKAASSVMILVIFVVGIIVIIEILPYLAGIGAGPTPGSLPVDQGVIISSVSNPASVSAGTKFDLTFQIENNINGKPASDINLCLDNLGVFSIVSNGGGQCVPITTLFTGNTVPESFTLSAPAEGAYENIPYAQELGYYLNYSYAADAAQSLEFVSQQASGSGGYPAPSSGSFGNTAGPVSIDTSAQQPNVYGTAENLNLLLSNVGAGIVLGPVRVTISMDSSFISVPQTSPGFTTQIYPNGTVQYIGNLSMGASGATITFPVVLNSTEQASLTSSNVPYISSNVHVSISYEYEEDGFFPVYLNSQSYYTG